MIRFKDHLLSSLHFYPLPDADVTVPFEGQKLNLIFDSKDVIKEASYDGIPDIWLSSLCTLITGMTVAEATQMSFSAWELAWKDDQLFWDLQLEISDKIFFPPLEMLHLALDTYLGREFLYQEESPLVCRCFGVRERDVLAFLKTSNDPTLDELSKATKAGMGCRSCVPQLKQWLLIDGKSGKTRFYKSKPLADWIEEIDVSLKRFPKSSLWNMHVEEMKLNTVIISYESAATQKEEEETGRELQGFLSAAVDADLVFFLRRAAQR